MKFFGRKSAWRDASRPVLSRGFSTWRATQGEWPVGYEPQVRDGFIGNPVAQRAVRMVSEGVGSAPISASDADALTLIRATSGGQALVETMAMQLLLHGNSYVQVLSDADPGSGSGTGARPRELFALRPERVAPGRWRLSELWRGRRGTEDAIVPHAMGSRFLLIEPDTGFALPAEVALAGVTVMASGLGDAAPYPVATSPSASRAVMPLSPVALIAVPVGAGDTELRWTRRSREGWPWRDGVDVPLGEEREAYRISWEGGAQESAECRFVYTAAMRTADVAARRVAVTFFVRQIGTAALSPPVILSVDIV